jgi:repressor LexA
MRSFRGYVAAGRPIEAVAAGETVAVPAALRSKRPCYVLQVRGDSMVEDGILDGDRVVIESRTHARNGEIVVALIDGEQATLKRIEQRPGKVILRPANATMAPIALTPDRV